MSSFALIANGEIRDLQETANKLSGFSGVIAVDGGLKFCRLMGIKPNLIVGDFDSATPEDLNYFLEIPKEKHPAHKDLSDTEIGVIAALERGAEEVAVFGAWGDRIDHTLAAISLLDKYKGKVRIETERETLYAIYDYKKDSSFPGQTISLFSLNGARGVTTRGLKWELQDQDLGNDFLSLSNVALGSSFEVRVKAGAVLCIKQHVPV
jgi:thiamine pyrophosphokinase